VTSSLPVFEA